MGNFADKLGGDKPIDVDLDTFKRKSIFHDIEDEKELEEYLDFIEKKEN